MWYLRQNSIGGWQSHTIEMSLNSRKINVVFLLEDCLWHSLSSLCEARFFSTIKPRRGTGSG